MFELVEPADWQAPEDRRVVSFSVPFVAGKLRPRHRINGWTYTPKANRTYEAAIRAAYLEAAQGAEPAPKDCPVSVLIIVHKELPGSTPKRVVAQVDTTKPDLDNAAKLVLDALNGAAYADDKQVTHLAISRTRRTRRGSYMEVSVISPAHWTKNDNTVKLESRRKNA